MTLLFLFLLLMEVILNPLPSSPDSRPYTPEVDEVRTEKDPPSPLRAFVAEEHRIGWVTWPIPRDSVIVSHEENVNKEGIVKWILRCFLLFFQHKSSVFLCTEAVCGVRKKQQRFFKKLVWTCKSFTSWQSIISQQFVKQKTQAVYE